MMKIRHSLAKLAALQHNALIRRVTVEWLSKRAPLIHAAPDDGLRALGPSYIPASLSGRTASRLVYADERYLCAYRRGRPWHKVRRWLPGQYLALGGTSVLRRAWRFLPYPRIAGVRVVIARRMRGFDEAMAGLAVLPAVAGGAERQDSVRLGPSARSA